MVRQIPVSLLARLLEEKQPVYLLDVRQPWEHDTCALPGSTLIPLQELAERADEVTPPEGAIVVAYCHHGVRSLSAAALLEQHGIANVASLAGGIDAWSIEIDPKMRRY
jgi:adenylyltransferase/sulfurtransferase